MGKNLRRRESVGGGKLAIVYPAAMELRYAHDPFTSIAAVSVLSLLFQSRTSKYVRESSYIRQDEAIQTFSRGRSLR